MIATSSAPLLSGIREKGSTFYTFSSAINDIDKTLLNSNYKMAPSKFVVLDLPQWKRSDTEWSIFEEYENIGLPNQTDPNIIMPKLIQNYIENALILHYKYQKNDDSLQTITESLFWKLMSRINAIDLKKHNEEINNSIPSSIYIENNDSHDNLIKYINDINILNNIQKDGQSYSEVFLHIPQQAQKNDNITLKNLNLNLNVNKFPESDSPEYTVGLEDFPLKNTKAIYDTEDRKYDFSTHKQQLGIYFDDIDKNGIDSKKDFNFNAILVYYDIWSEQDKSFRATNLYGILFINKFDDNGSGSFKINSFEKYAPSKNSTGNGYSARLNIKTTSNSEQTTSEISINDYNSVSMELYMNALIEMNSINKKYDTLINQLSTDKKDVNQFLQVINKIETNFELQQRLDILEQMIKNNQKTSRISNEDLFELFSNTINEIKKSNISNINIQQISGNYYFDIEGNIFVLDPENKRWQWDIENKKWNKLD